MKSLLTDKGVVWLAWERHRRTVELCRYLDMQPVIFESTLPRLFKHPFFVVKTILYLLRKRPSILIVQNPSIVLTLVGCLFRRILGYYYIVDAHNGGIVADEPIAKKIQFIYRLWPKKSDLTIVTNKYMAEIINKRGGKSFILPDKLPLSMVESKRRNLDGRINILCVSTFDSDEPFREVFMAAKGLPEDYTIYVTGNYSKVNAKLPKECPKQIRLTGFLSDEDYDVLLNSVDLVMDLTSREDCLVCGAYEAVAQGKPLILTDTVMLKEFFFKGAVFTKNDSVGIQHAILKATSNLERLSCEVLEVGSTMEERWSLLGKDLVGILRKNLKC